MRSTRRKYNYRFSAYGEMRDRIEAKEREKREAKAKREETVYVPNRAAAIRMYK